MKRLTALLLAALTALALAGCGTQTSAGSGSSVDSATASASVPKKQNDAPPSITLSKKSETRKSEDKKVTLLNSEWNTAVVSVPGNKKAQKAIQDDLDQILKEFQKTSNEYYQDAQEVYEDNLLGSDAFAKDGYYHSLTITKARCDNHVISLVFDESSFTGGAHGINNRYTRNYDVSTGKVLKLSDLGSGVTDVAYNKILKFVNQIHKKDDLFFGEAKKEDLKDVIANDLFYFNKNGLVFISGQYVLQSYAEGIVEFTISYDDLKGKLKDAYNLGGGVTQCETGLGIYTFKADGTLDTSRIDYSNTSEGDGSAA